VLARDQFARIVDTNQTSWLRDVVGFLIGGLLAAVAAALVLLAFFPLPPEPDPRNHTGEALMILCLVMLFSGGFIGRRGLSATSWPELLPSVGGSIVAAVSLCWLARLDWRETAILMGFASVGIVTSAVTMLFLGRRFPPKAKIV
jgi:hypothetical protein